MVNCEANDALSALMRGIVRFDEAQKEIAGFKDNIGDIEIELGVVQNRLDREKENLSRANGLELARKDECDNLLKEWARAINLGDVYSFGPGKQNCVCVGMQENSPHGARVLFAPPQEGAAVFWVDKAYLLNYHQDLGAQCLDMGEQ